MLAPRRLRVRVLRILALMVVILLYTLLGNLFFLLVDFLLFRLLNTGALSVPAARPIRPSMNPSVDLARPSARPSMRPTAMATDGVHGPARPSFAPHLRPRGTPDVPAGEAFWRTSWRSTPCGW